MDSIKVGFNRYGKANVRILKIDKITSTKHEMKELRVRILLEGSFEDAYIKGDNSQIVPTETQKNTLYVLSKKYSVEPIEEWSINVAKDFMERYSHISAVNMKVEELPWDRIIIQDQPHNHAFQKSGKGIRYCNMRLSRHGQIDLTSGFKELQVMKTTQSGFEGFIKDEFTTLKESKDRVMCTKIQCEWKYEEKKIEKGIGYSHIFDEVNKVILKTFAGDPHIGTYSSSVQRTLFQIGKEVLQQFHEIQKISFVLPNIHYYLVDFSQFKTYLTNNNEVFFTFDGAHGRIEGTIERKDLISYSKL